MAAHARIKPASRVTAVRPFLVMEVLERAKELEAQGRSIVHLEVGEPDFDTPASVCRAADEAIAAGRTHYTHSLGDPALREAIAEHYASAYGVEVDPDCIVVAAG